MAFESIRMASTYYAAPIFDAVNDDIAVEPGMLGQLKGIKEGMIYNYQNNIGDAEAQDIVIVDQPAVDELAASRAARLRRTGFVVEPGTVFRVRSVAVNDIIGLTEDLFSDNGSRELLNNTTDFTTTPVYVYGNGIWGATTTKPEEGTYGIIEAKRVSGSSIVTTARTYGKSNVIYAIRLLHIAGTAGNDGE